MREINTSGNPKRRIENSPNGNTYQKMQPRRRLNKKKFAAAVTVLILLVAGVVFSIYMLERRTDDAGADAIASVDAAQAGGTSLVGKSIVVDAGHGGFDPGATGVSGSCEAELNLAVAEDLKKDLEAAGATVIMTRSDENAIAENKDDDMAERKRIIQESGSDIVVSIHMNSHTEATVSGPVVIFMPGSVQGEKLAKCIQSSLGNLVASGCGIRSEGLFVLKSGAQPAVLVECGFLSNQAEEAKLLQSEYQLKVADAVCKGIIQDLTGGELA